MDDAPPDLAGVRHRHERVADGVRLHVAEAGDPAAPPVLLLHGWPQHWWMWRHLIPVLAGTRRVLAIDLRGLGWSDAPRSGYRKDEMARDVLELMDRLELERVAIVGHDWGGYVGHLLAGLAPERTERLVTMSCPPPHVRIGVRDLPGLVAFAYIPVLAAPLLGERAAGSRAFLGLVERVAGAAPAWDDRDRELYLGRFDDPARARAAAQIYRTFAIREALARPAAPRPTAPLLALHGERDPIPASLVPGAEIIPGAGHWLPEEAPTTVNERVAAFLG